MVLGIDDAENEGRHFFASFCFFAFSCLYWFCLIGLKKSKSVKTLIFGKFLGFRLFISVRLKVGLRPPRDS